MKQTDKKKELVSPVKSIDMGELKPCPLCGSTDLDDKGYGILCRICGIWFGDSTRFSREDLTYREVWNRRKRIVQKGECVECQYLGSAPEEIHRTVSKKCRDCSVDTRSNFVKRED